MLHWFSRVEYPSDDKFLEKRALSLTGKCSYLNYLPHLAAETSYAVTKVHIIPESANLIERFSLICYPFFVYLSYAVRY